MIHVGGLRRIPTNIHSETSSRGAVYFDGKVNMCPKDDEHEQAFLLAQRCFLNLQCQSWGWTEAHMKVFMKRMTGGATWQHVDNQVDVTNQRKNISLE